MVTIQQQKQINLGCIGFAAALHLWPVSDTVGERCDDWHGREGGPLGGMAWPCD